MCPKRLFSNFTQNLTLTLFYFEVSASTLEKMHNAASSGHTLLYSQITLQCTSSCLPQNYIHASYFYFIKISLYFATLHSNFNCAVILCSKSYLCCTRKHRSASEADIFYSDLKNHVWIQLQTNNFNHKINTLHKFSFLKCITYLYKIWVSMFALMHDWN